MESAEYWGKFYDYLNWENKGMATSDMGLVANAPQEAIDAYEQFKRDEEEERLNSDDYWE